MKTLDCIALIDCTNIDKIVRINNIRSKLKTWSKVKRGHFKLFGMMFDHLYRFFIGVLSKVYIDVCKCIGKDF